MAALTTTCLDPPFGRAAVAEIDWEDGWTATEAAVSEADEAAPEARTATRAAAAASPPRRSRRPPDESRRAP
jgi:hypothetical protein